MNNCSRCLSWLCRKVREFFGITQEDRVEVWRVNFQQKAQSGQVGISLSNALLSNTNIQYQRIKVVDQLVETVSEVALDDDDTAISNHILGKSSHFLTGYEQNDFAQESDNESIVSLVPSLKVYDVPEDTPVKQLNKAQDVAIEPKNSDENKTQDQLDAQTLNENKTVEGVSIEADAKVGTKLADESNLQMKESCNESEKFYDASENLNQSASNMKPLSSSDNLPSFEVKLNNFMSTKSHGKNDVKMSQDFHHNQTYPPKRNKILPASFDDDQTTNNMKDKNNSATDPYDLNKPQPRHNLSVFKSNIKRHQSIQNQPSTSSRTNFVTSTISEGLFKNNSLNHKPSSSMIRSFYHLGSLTKFDLKPSQIFEDYEVLEDEGERLTGQEAFNHYLNFTALEREMKIKEIKETKQWIIENYEWRIRTVQQLVEIAKAYYTKPEKEARKKWKDLRKEINQKSKHSSTDTRVKRAELKQFKPFFTYFIMLVHVMVFSSLTAIGYIHQIGLQQTVILKDNIPTFLGTESIHHWITPNIWIGSDRKFMIEMGAVFAPCIRDDIKLRLDYIHKYGDHDEVLGCCEVAMRNTAGTTLEEECDNKTNGVGVWKNGVMCSERTSGENSVHHNLRPCCHHHHLSTCELYSHSHCVFIGGIFYRDKDHCSQVNCLDSLCGSNITTLHNSGLPYSPRQGWRIFTSLFFCHGLIHLVLLVCVEWIIMRPIEKCTGWFRLMLIYSICGSAGVLAASIISPYEPQVGSTAAVLGSIGILIVQIIQAWNIIAKSKQQAAKICIVVTFFLVSGLLPGLSNFGILTGIITGILCAMVFLPYITLGRNQYHGRIVLLIISSPLLFLLIFVLIFTFLKVQNSEGCMSCQYFECMPFAEGICVE